ncbi:PAS domain S-box protein [Haloplanus rallus]|uniref:histidine kinase n=1 Tax=Haloplanus rallus TaxID=1816183 RepID=A0A6B9F547_9EURY|nr:PAS domain S-box protein [Haloplanus rallus]QGX94502.1 PAS domain S-box protein [Haloplanus rallus]
MTETIRVLLVDDSSDLASVAAELLAREDDRFDVSTETDPSAVVDRVEAEPVDCLVCDYGMPGMDGLDVLRAVRERWPDLPFVLFTGKGSEEIASEAISAGATDYVRKGTAADNYALLANRVAQAVAKRRSSRRAARLEALRDLARDVNGALVRADDQAAAERAVCDRLVATDPYTVAWIGSVDVAEGSTTVRTAVGEPVDAVDHRREPVHRAATTREPAVATDPDRSDPETVAAVPLDVDEDRYGLLVAGAAAPDAIDGFELDFLAELGEDVASALERLRIRAELSESEAKYRRLVEQNLVGVYLIQDGEFEYVNPRLAAMFGYTQEELLTELTPSDVVIEADREKLRRNLERRESGDVDDLRYTLRGERKDGSEIEFEVHGGRIDYRGEPAIMGTLLDVTEQRRHQRELERSRTEYRELFEGFPDAVFVREPGDTFRIVSDIAVDRLGYDREELLSMKPIDIDPNLDPDDEDDRFDALSDDGSLRFDTVHETKAGDRIPVAVNSTLIPYRGDEAILSTARDISERVAREEELRRQRDRMEGIASVVSHDLRNPLNVAAGRIEAVRRACDCDHDDLDGALDALDRMNRLIDDLLTLTGRHDVDPSPVSLSSTVDRAWRNVATDGATLRREVDGTIRADGSRLEQVFENLFRNSVEHGSSERGDGATADPDLTVTVGELPDGFYVADDGSGIPTADRERIFESGYSTDQGGTGLGLSIVQDVIEAHDWEIRVTSGSEGGARFEITGVEGVE